MIFSRRKSEARGLDQAAVGALYDKHAPWLLAVCLRYTGNREDAEDVLHDGFMKIIRSLPAWKQTPGSSVEAWMRRIMVNTALNYIRDHKKERMFTELEPALESFHEAPEDDDAFGGCEFTKDQLLSFVCELPSGYRTVFNLYVMEDYSHKEIAAMLGISENTSKSQLMKARSALKKRLLEYQSIATYEKAESNR